MTLGSAGFILCAIGWVVWMIPFFQARKRQTKAAMVDRRARWGIAIQAIAFWMIWIGPFWMRPTNGFRVAVSVIFFILGDILSWTAVRTLGRQWRVDAGLNQDHELVRAGPYRLIRHPIYCSMLCMLVATGAFVTPGIMLAGSIVIFLIGTEIRVRIEDSLLTARFGDEFRAYQRSVRAYIPGLR